MKFTVLRVNGDDTDVWAAPTKEAVLAMAMPDPGDSYETVVVEAPDVASARGMIDAFEEQIVAWERLYDAEVAKAPSDRCDGPCPGWGVFNDAEIQRCDQCGVFESDDEAREHVERLLA